ncbi:hypothetical protein E2C01_097661 [Portunus trituberculatus]|uniref:Uncharacterized protein n=1 Tax=Portunus trituberculatus TaxID=210409 RepID=A0A5B7K0Z3_PORTR|nr:hypothetical protein [Portunus trituberculatus]
MYTSMSLEVVSLDSLWTARVGILSELSDVTPVCSSCFAAAAAVRHPHQPQGTALHGVQSLQGEW